MTLWYAGLLSSASTLVFWIMPQEPTFDIWTRTLSVQGLDQIRERSNLFRIDSTSVWFHFVADGSVFKTVFTGSCSKQYESTRDALMYYIHQELFHFFLLVIGLHFFRSSFIRENSGVWGLKPQSHCYFRMHLGFGEVPALSIKPCQSFWMSKPLMDIGRQVTVCSGRLPTIGVN